MMAQRSVLRAQIISCLACAVFALGSMSVRPAAGADNAPLSEQAAHAIATDAYLYLYPLVIMDLTRRQMTNLPAGKEPAAGIAAMVSLKRRGRHSTFGTIYYWSLAVVVASATGLSLVRWAENYHLFVLGALSLVSATVARAAPRQRWCNWIRLHITGMGSSYILMLTAFYVDNGKHLPLWRELPQMAFWVLPTALGIPIVVWALLRHPLARRATLADRAGSPRSN
jgi:hypothetical protein